jgi:hypothetical protein
VAVGITLVALWLEVRLLFHAFSFKQQKEEVIPYKDPAARAAASLRSYYKLRQQLLDLKGNHCEDCPAETNLEIHHTAEDGKNHVRRGSRYKEYRRLLVNPDEYTLQCGACHQRTTMKYVRSFKNSHTVSHT